MTYAGHAGGTFYPEGGMHTPAHALATMAQKMNVSFHLNTTVQGFTFAGDAIDSVCVKGTHDTDSMTARCEQFDGVIAAGDYHHIEQDLLPRHLRRYSESHWDQQVLSPSVVLFYLGFDKQLPGILHHTLFFDDGLAATERTVFEDHILTEKPAFYVSATSKTDKAVAPPGGDAVFVLVPLSYKLLKQDGPALRATLLDHVLDRMEAKMHTALRSSLVYKNDYGPKDFAQQFHAFKGNAFGHANLLSQSLALKPSMDSLVPNMVFAGHLTHPGPGVPPALVSGNVAAGLLHSKLHPPPPTYFSSISHLVSSLLFWGTVAVVLCSVVLRSVPLWDAHVRCIDLMFRHGKTYYMASTLMAWEQYMDTCTLYAVFREADDIVDCFAPPEIKQADLDEYMARFYEARRTGVIREDDPLIFKAMIPTIRKYGYEDRLWKAFFRSVASDVSRNVCRTMDDCMIYMDGSAAVLGEFMLPLLGPDGEMTAEERRVATPHARDLGNAFQLMNMIRDIGEDIGLDRQYVPVELCQRYGVRLEDKNPSDPAFGELMEHMLNHTDTFYESADIGIAMLPVRVRDSIKVARMMYCKIHEKIREVNYDIFTTRPRVSSRHKLKIASSFLPKSKLLWMIFADRLSWLSLEIYYMAIPVTLTLYGIAVSNLIDVEVSHEAFLMLFIAVPNLALGIFCAYRCTDDLRRATPWMVLLCVISTLWTAPWGNHLVKSGVWSYGASRISFGLIGHVPVAEYLFFSLRTILCSLVWLTVFNQRDPLQWPAKNQLRSHWRHTGLTALALMGVCGLACMQAPRLEYLGLIMAAGAPPLMLLWAVGAEALLAHGKCVVMSVFFSSAYLSIADQWALHHDLWSISQEHALPLLMRDLPVEEVVFFSTTSLLCNFGLTLAMVVANCGFRFKEVMDWGHAAASAAAAPSNDKAIESESKDSISLVLNAIVLGTLAMMWGFETSVPRSIEILIMVLTTVVIGFPHAALDPLLIHHNNSSDGGMNRAWLQYFGLLGLGTATWLLQPELALTAFLVMTVYHFGEGDTHSNPKSLGLVEMVARGGSFLVTIRSNHAEVVEIFTLIVGGNSEQSIANVMNACTIMQGCYVVALVSVVTHLVSNLQLASARNLLLEIVSINLMYYVAPPLLAFAVYFNLYHSQRHVLRVMKMSTWRASGRDTLLVGAVFTVLSTAILGMWYYGSQVTTSSMMMNASPLVRPMFIVFSVLTVPHMVLVHEHCAHGEQDCKTVGKLHDDKVSHGELMGSKGAELRKPVHGDAYVLDKGLEVV